MALHASPPARALAWSGSPSEQSIDHRVLASVPRGAIDDDHVVAGAARARLDDAAEIHSA
jgi:hypothetical protein